MEKDFSQYLIKEGKHWDIKIHHVQNCLGKCLLWYKGQENKDLLELTLEEQEEFWQLAKKAKMALDKIFQPDKYNYLCAGNRTPHLHLHIMPRYAKPREFEGETFEDVDYGDFPKTGKEISEELLFKIRDAIKEALNI